MVKTILLSIFGLVALAALFSAYYFLDPGIQSPNSLLSPLTSQKPQPNPFEAYTFPALAGSSFPASSIELIGVIDKTETYSAYQFAFTAEGKRITGQANLPADYQLQPNPVVILIRGYVDPAIYQTGVGTKNAAAVFAQNGYVTFAPDFAGYGDSDLPDEDTFIDRFQKPVVVLTLIESVKQLDYTDPENIFLWGHSNGGQIAISVLEISREPIPTTLWAPVTKPFPYNILYYTDESADNGKALRAALAGFEAKNDADLFSIHNYLNWINAPIQLHQGGNDDAIPIEWSNDFVAKLNQVKESTDSGQLDITYYTYPSADHNLRPDWNTVVSRDLQFFQKHLK